MTKSLEQYRFSRPEYYFKLQKFALSFMAFWPDVPEINKFRIGLAVFNGLYLFMICVVEVNFAYVHRNNLGLMLDCLTPTVTKFVTGIKILVLVYYRKELKNLLSIGFTLFTKDQDIDAKKINDKMSKYGYLFTLAILTFSNFTSTTFIVLPIVTNIFHYAKGEELTRELPFKAVFWFETETNPNYLIGYALLMYSSVLTVFSFSAIDGLFVGFCVYFTAQFEMVKLRLNTFLEKEFEYSNEISKFTEKQNARIYKRLTELVQSHNFTIDLCDQMSNLLTINVLSHFISAAFVICICLLSLMLAEGAQKAIFVNYIMAASSQIIAYAVGGTIMGIASHDIKFAAYSFPWYKCDYKVKRTIFMMITRADRETGISVPFFKANIETFGSIVSAAMSYITLFKSFL